MPKLILYDDGSSVMEFSPTETNLHIKVWSGFRYKDPANINVVCSNIVLLEMHKFVLLEPKRPQ